MTSRSTYSLLVLTATLLLAGCSKGDGAAPDGRPELIVFAAASTTEIVTKIATAFDRARVRPSFGSSSALARQIKDGAPADVYISASEIWVDYLSTADLLASPPRSFCGNSLVCVTASGSALSAQRPANARALAEHLDASDRVAIAGVGTPAGDYSRESLTASADLARLEAQLVGLDDVRAVLQAVASREAVAGFVYMTDARAAAVDVLFTFDPATHHAIEYFAAVPKTAADPALASAFVGYLESPEAQAILAAAGFLVGGK